MKFLIKLFCLLSFLSSFCFSFEFSDDVNYDAFRGQKFEYFGDTFVTPNFFYGGYIRIENDVFELKNFDSPPFEIFNVSISNLGTGFRFSSKYDLIYVYSSSFPSAQVRCVFDEKGEVLSCSNKSLGPPAKFHTFSFALYYGLSKVATCGSDENFNIKTKKCSPACPAGQSWDIENSICYSDCTDKDLNKFGYSNGTSQGGCIDCSNAFTNDDIASCICAGHGTSMGKKNVFLNPDGPFVSTFCADGVSITFKKRSNEKSDKDKDKKNDNNSTNSSNKDNSNPDKKDNNENSNNSSGESGNSSNNNSGGSAGNGSSGGGGSGVGSNPGNDKEDGKGDGKQDGKEEGKGDDNVGPANLDYEGLKASADTFEGQFKTAIDDSFSFVNDVKASLTDTIQKIKDGNLMSLKKGAVPTTCPLSFQIDMTYFSKNLTFDFCKIVSPVSSSLYILFYLGFFILFLVVTIKLFILTFLGW